MKQRIIVLASFLLLTLTTQVIANESLEQLVKKASIEYADKKKQELKETIYKKSILTIYRKVYPHLPKSDRKAFNKLGKLGLKARDLNNLASDLASNDPEVVKKAGEKLAIGIGSSLAKQIKTPGVRDKMSKLLGGVEKIKEIATVLGSVSGGDKNAGYKFVADMVINATGGGGVVGFYTTAHGVMKYAKDAYVDATIEEFYQKFKKTPNRKDLKAYINYGRGNHVAIRDKIITEKKNKLESLGDTSNLPDKLIKHLTQVDEEEFVDRLITGFKARKVKEEKDKKSKVYEKKMQAQAKEILKRFDRTAQSKYGEKWWIKKPYSLSRFLEMVYENTRKNPRLSAKKTHDLELMSELLSKELIYGKNSQEYQDTLKNFNKIVLGRKILKKKIESKEKKINKKITKKVRRESCNKEKTAKEKRRCLIMRKLIPLNHTKFINVLKKLNVKSPDPYLDCLCRNAGYGSPQTRQFYHPDTLGKYDARYSCQHPGEPCVVAGYGCSRHPLPKDRKIRDSCMESNRLNMKKDKNGKIDPKSGVRLDDYIAKELQKGH